jgi:predicted lipoprotein with Yx(FWY)xxD motif
VASGTAAATPAAGGATGATIKTGTTSAGAAVLTDGAGMTLYTFDNDTTPGKSSCNGGCATTWPPAATTSTTPPTVAGAAGTFSVITRDDGSMQVAYNGDPLYRFANDKAAGEANGDGLNNVWHIAKP